MLTIFNTITNKKEEFKPITDRHVKMYVCGVTVYDYCHIGHARSSVIFDVIRRYLLYNRYNVTFVKNFTDIDDKIINKSIERSIPWDKLAEEFIKEHNIDMKSLNILEPDYTPRATEHIDDMISMCIKLIEKKLAYEVNGNVYFSVRSFPEYGKLSHRKLDEMIAGARTPISEEKRYELDFALWKKSKENEPGWNSPWGTGRPGWHIECSAMSFKLLGIPFDIHGGGMDLIFPHHENEIAQSESTFDKTLASYWIHNGFVNINKEKMSKSTGNFFTIRSVTKEFDAEVLRLFLMSKHYRGPLDFSYESLIEFENALNRFYLLYDKLLYYKPFGKGENLTDSLTNMSKHFNEEFCKILDDDFNTPGAIALIFDQIRNINKLIDNKMSIDNFNCLVSEFNKILEIVKNVLGIFNKTPQEWFKSNLDIDEDKLLDLIAERNTARIQKDFKKADEIRVCLKKYNVELHDIPTGTRYTSKKTHNKGI